MDYLEFVADFEGLFVLIISRGKHSLNKGTAKRRKIEWKLWIILSITFLLCICVNPVSSLKCYECDSTENPECGRSSGDIVTCNVTEPGQSVVCALQRQLPEGSQLFAILRTCYSEGTLQGLNSSLGCRDWYNPKTHYSAYYCFCDTDYCNGSEESGIITPLLVAALILQFLICQQRS